MSQEAAAEVLKRAGLKIGDSLTEESLRNLRAAATAVDQHLEIFMHTDGRGGVSIVLMSVE